MYAPAANRSQFVDLFGSNMLPVLEELFRVELERHPSRREQLFKLVPHMRDIWQYSEQHDLDLFSKIEEGAEYSFKARKQGSNKTLTIDKYGLGFSISEEMVADGKFQEIGDLVRKLGRSGRESQEISAMNIFNNAFDSETTADGQYVFSASHALPSGGTFRNLLSTPSDLSPSSLDTMLSDFETQFVGDSGIIYKMVPKALLCHPSLRRYAREVVGSDLKADTADNNMNSFKEDNLQVVSSPHLTDSDAWFLLAAPEETGLRIIVRNPIETKAAGPDVGFATDAILYKARYREALGATHAYGIFGTPGAS